MEKVAATLRTLDHLGLIISLKTRPDAKGKQTQ